MERRSFIRVMGGGVVLAAAPALVACSSVSKTRCLVG